MKIKRIKICIIALDLLLPKICSSQWNVAFWTGTTSLEEIQELLKSRQTDNHKGVNLAIPLLPTIFHGDGWKVTLVLVYGKDFDNNILFWFTTYLYKKKFNTALANIMTTDIHHQLHIGIPVLGGLAPKNMQIRIFFCKWQSQKVITIVILYFIFSITLDTPGP